MNFVNWFVQAVLGGARRVPPYVVPERETRRLAREAYSRLRAHEVTFLLACGWSYDYGTSLWTPPKGSPKYGANQDRPREHNHAVNTQKRWMREGWA